MYRSILHTYAGPLLLFLSSMSSLTVAQIPSFLSTDFAENVGVQELEVIYGESKIVDGDQFSAADVSQLPTFKVCDTCGIAPETNYMIMLLDVDAGGEGTGETPQNLHYLKTDFGAGLGGTDLVSSVQPLIPYLAPNPGPGTGKHRYVWLLFLQRRGMQASDVRGVPGAGDRSFDVLAWIRENDLDFPKSGVHFVVESEGAPVQAPPDQAPPEETLVTTTTAVTTTTPLLTTDLAETTSTTLPPTTTTSTTLVDSTTTSTTSADSITTSTTSADSTAPIPTPFEETVACGTTITVTVTEKYKTPKYRTSVGTAFTTGIFPYPTANNNTVNATVGLPFSTDGPLDSIGSAAKLLSGASFAAIVAIGSMVFAL